MRLSKLSALLAIAIAAGAPAPPSAPAVAPGPQAASWQVEPAKLSVMSYNVKGMPWPAASGRPQALEAIGERLRAMRAQGVQPHIVLLQEAFTAKAEQIGKLGGYRYFTRGPVVAPHLPAPPLGANFAAAASWSHGEEVDNFVDSGLVILSDYPIVRTHRMAFPHGACAGFDCLASKGLLVAWIAVPGLDRPLAVVDTHLNSRGATHVALDRADAANLWQVRAVRRELDTAIGSDEPAIFGGDLNIGQVPGRMAMLNSNPPLGPKEERSLRLLVAARKIAPGSFRTASAIVARNKDMLMVRSAPGMRISPQAGWVPFETGHPGVSLSDHAGYVVEFKSERTS